MTQDHRADARGEAARLRRLGTNSLIMDSFGETRYLIPVNFPPLTEADALKVDGRPGKYAWVCPI